MADIQSTSNPSSSHQALYKHNGVSTNLLHQKHREETVELRKKKRDDSFARTRRLLELSRDQVVEPALRSVFDQDLINDLMSTDDERVFLALQTYARLFSSSECVDQMHEIELVKVIVEIFMRSEPFTNMESVCVIVLSKLSNDFDRITCFLNAGVISKLINSFGSTNLESLEHAVFLLEEIVRHDSNTRSICTNLEILPASVKLYLNYDQLSLRRQILTLICNYFDFEVPLYETSKELLEFLHYVILNEADELLLSDAFDILTKITQFSNLHANLLVNDGFLGEAISFLNGDVAHSCMMFVKAIASYGEEHIKVLADLGYLEQIWNIASSTGNSTKKRGDSFAIIGTFIKSGYLHINPKVVSTITSHLIGSIKESGFEVRRQSLFAIEQLLIACDDADILFQFTDSSFLASLCDLLTVMHVDTVISAIFCLTRIMDYGVANGIEVELRSVLEEHNAMEKFDFLTNSQSYEVFKRASAFVDKYFSELSSDELDLRC